MANNKQEFSAEQIAAMQEELAQLKEENGILREKKTAANDHTGKIVKGTFTAKLEAPGGKKSTKKVQFVPGTVYCRLQNGEKVWSEDLLALANGKKLEEKQLKRSPQLQGVKAEDAATWLTTLVRRQASFLREVK